MNASSSILVLGGTGKIGRRVGQRLAAAGHRVRIASRNAETHFDWEDPQSWHKSLTDVDSVFVTHPDLTEPGAQEQIAEFAAEAIARGIRRLVLLSARADSSLQAAEAGIKIAGAEWTVVRPGWFNQNFSEGFFRDDVLAGEISLPVGEASEAFVDADDIADVIAAALTEPGHSGRTYELSGPRLLSFYDVANLLSLATGRTVTYKPVNLNEFRVTLREKNMPEELADMYADITNGTFAFVVHGVRDALGREPKDFSAFAFDAASAGQWSVDRSTN